MSATSHSPLHGRIYSVLLRVRIIEERVMQINVEAQNREEIPEIIQQEKSSLEDSIQYEEQAEEPRVEYRMSVISSTHQSNAYKNPLPNSVPWGTTTDTSCQEAAIHRAAEITLFNKGMLDREKVSCDCGNIDASDWANADSKGVVCWVECYGCQKVLSELIQINYGLDDEEINSETP